MAKNQDQVKQTSVKANPNLGKRPWLPTRELRQGETSKDRLSSATSESLNVSTLDQVRLSRVGNVREREREWRDPECGWHARDCFFVDVT